jgi:hypothetical protein
MRPDFDVILCRYFELYYHLDLAPSEEDVLNRRMSLVRSYRHGPGWTGLKLSSVRNFIHAHLLKRTD